MGWRQRDVSLSPHLLPVRLQRGRWAPPPPDNRAPPSGSPRHPREAAACSVAAGFGGSTTGGLGCSAGSWKGPSALWWEWGFGTAAWGL